MMRIRSNTGKIASVLIVVLSLLVTIPVAYAGDADALAATLSSGDRADADKVRDAGRKPAEVVTFLGVASGMTVIDLIAASGYYTEVLSVAVGEKGKVYAQNGAFVLKMREGANENDNKELHRMTKAQAVKSVTDAGFEIVAEGEMLRNSEDDRAAYVFAEGMRGNTDRFVLKSRKP